MGGRYPDRDAHASDGTEFEEIASQVLIDVFGFDERCRAFPDRERQVHVGESLAGVEYKHLQKAWQWWHFEFVEKTARAGSWWPSGVLRRDNTAMYVCGNNRVILGFNKEALKEYCFSRKHDTFHHPTCVSWRVSWKDAFRVATICAVNKGGGWEVKKDDRQKVAA